jgi:hypothetical protein
MGFMGIEVVIIVLIILGVVGAGFYLYANPQNSEIPPANEPPSKGNASPNGQAERKRDDGISTGGLYPEIEEEIEAEKEEAIDEEEADDDVPDRKLSVSTTVPSEPPKPGQPSSSIPPPAPPPSPPSLESAVGTDTPLIGEIEYHIDDDDEFMTGAIPDSEEPEPVIEDILTTESDDKPDKKKRKKESPEEIIGWMDDLKEQIEDVTEVMPSIGDEASEDRLDVTYPDKTKIIPATTAHFSAFYPKEVQAEQRYGVYIYAHAESMLAKITEDAQKFKEELGGNIPKPRIAKTSKALAHGTKITVLLESDELEFEPDMLTKKWHGDWTRYEFEFRPKTELTDETAFVRASIMVMGFEIAKIKFAIDIVAPQMQAMRSPSADELPTNPFALAKMQSTTTGGYDKIFISYSRKDKMIAEAFKIIQEAAGNDVFFDVDDIRTGEDWQAAIARAIDEADYLQLFWSEHSANSEWCGYEWEYTLNYRCKDNKCREFIRPVWWDDPMPKPPKSLGHLNFRRMDVAKLMQVDEE